MRNVTFWFLLIGAAAALLLSAPSAVAQGGRAQPQIGYVYPAGLQRGSTTKVVVGGQNLANAKQVWLSSEGVSAVVVDYHRPLSQKEINELREQQQQLQEKRGRGGKGKLTSEEEKRLAEIREKLAGRVNRPANPALAETVTLEVAAASSAQLGAGELRLLTASGLSNPLVFDVGALAETSDDPVTATTPPASAEVGRRQAPAGAVPSRPARGAELPSLVNGQILPGETDRWKFVAKKGEVIVASVRARALVPYLADAVPGWFQPTLALHDEKGHEVAYCDDRAYDPDPSFAFEVPADGAYVVSIKDAIYRGREDFVYRLALGALPYVSSIRPLGAQSGREVRFELAGANLSATGYAFDGSKSAPGRYGLTVRGMPHAQRLPFVVDECQSTPETESGSPDKDSLVVTLPAALDGTIGQAGDIDRVAFRGRKGDDVVLEAQARRLGSPLDAVLEVFGPDGKTIASNDDTTDISEGLLTHHADPRVQLRLPSDGLYTVALRDTRGAGGAAFGYRLQMRPAQPDFELRLAPSSVNLKAGAATPIAVHAIRRDGFAGEIVLRTVKGSGFEVSGGRIPAGQDRVRVTLRANSTTGEGLHTFQLEGIGMCAGRRTVRPIVPADDRMQAFAYQHLVPAQAFLVHVSGRGPSLRLASDAVVRMKTDQRAEIRFARPGNRTGQRLHLELSNPPEGVTMVTTRNEDSHLVAVIEMDRAKVTPGLAGNLIVNAVAERAAGNAKGGAANRAQRNVVAVADAVPFEVVEP